MAKFRMRKPGVTTMKGLESEAMVTVGQGREVTAIAVGLHLGPDGPVGVTPQIQLPHHPQLPPHVSLESMTDLVATRKTEYEVSVILQTNILCGFGTDSCSTYIHKK
jgi:hypothetical protein